MKKYFFILILALPFLGCGKTEDINNSDTEVGISRVTNFVDLVRNGEPTLSIVKGTAFVDPGAKATEAGTNVPVTVSGTVNVNTPGLYSLTYSAVNKDGFSKSVSRTVVVIAGPETPGVDLSGSYSYVGTGAFTATVTKIGQGLYSASNAWSAATVIPVLFVSLDGLTITVPTQTTGYGPAQGTGTFTPSSGRLVYKLDLTSQGIAGSTRTWQKL